MMIYPISTEKAIGLVSKANTLLFVVPRDTKKEDVKKFIEQEYKVKVDKIGIHITFKGEKRAFVKLKKEFSAMELASKLKIL